MNRDTLLALLLANHNEDLLHSPEGGDGAHVCQVWEDGEITSQKAGYLLHQRHLHTLSVPHPELVANPLPLPLAMYNHQCVCIPFAIYDQVKALLWGVPQPA